MQVSTLSLSLMRDKTRYIIHNSPDLTPLDFYLRGSLERKIYNPETLHEINLLQKLNGGLECVLKLKLNKNNIVWLYISADCFSVQSCKYSIKNKIKHSECVK